MDTFELKVSKRAADDLAAFADELRETGPTEKLSGPRAGELRSLATVLRETIFAEASGKVAFVVTEKRVDVVRLLERPDTLLSPLTFDALPTLAQFDWKEASRCLAFERPTATAFHLLRCTESVLRAHWESLSGEPVFTDNWAMLVAALRERKLGSEVLLANLDNIRKSFRNPTQHPEKIYDVEEAQDLFWLCADVITRMVRTSQVGGMDPER